MTLREGYRAESDAVPGSGSLFNPLIGTLTMSSMPSNEAKVVI